MQKPRVSEHLYQKLPNIYRTEDAKVKGAYPLPLKRYLQILGVGFDFMEDKIAGLLNLFDIDNCPVEFLDKIVETMGFKFPYALPENEQRRFVKVLPHLYKTKGTTQSFEYLAREIFGTKSSTRAYKQRYKKGMSVQEWRKIFIEITTDGEQLNLGRKEEYFRKFAELVRPVNTIVVVLLMVYYSDFYSRVDRAKEEVETLKVFENFKNENYRFNLFIDGVDARLGGQHLILSDDLDYSFILNRSHLYSNQKIEFIDKIREEILSDSMFFSSQESFDRRRFSDLLLPFSINQSYVCNANFGIGYPKEFIERVTENSKDDLSIIVRDVFNRDYIRIGGEDLDSYRHRQFVNNIDVCDLNHNLITKDRETAFQLNSSTTYNSQEVVSYDTIKEECLGYKVSTGIEKEKFDSKKVSDNLTPFSICTSTLNNLNYGMEGFINEGSIHDVNEDVSQLKSKDEKEVIELKDVYALTDSYRDNVLVNNASIHDIKNPFFLRQDLGSLFTLNQTKTYGSQRLKRLKKLKDKHFDLCVETPFTDMVTRRGKDSEYPFVLNCSALDNSNWNLGYEKFNNTDIKTKVEEDKYTKVVRDILVSTSLKKSAQFDSYRHNILINGKSVYDINNNLILGGDELPSMKLNSARTFGSQSIVPKKDILEETQDMSTMSKDEELIERKIKDTEYPFTMNHSSINNKGLQLKFESNMADDIRPHDEDNAKKKLTDELLVEQYTDVSEDEKDLKMDYESSTEATYTRAPSMIGNIKNKLGSCFFTNDIHLFANLAY